jgi:hypothetical protein
MQHIRDFLKKEITNQPEPATIDYTDLVAVEDYLRNNFDATPNPKELFNGKLQAYKTAAIRVAAEKKELQKYQQRQDIIRMWTYDEMRQHALMRAQLISEKEGFEFVIDEYNKDAFHLLSLYFSNNPEFEQFGIREKKYSLKKGILLQSGVRGTGKSVLLKCFQINKRLSFGYKHTTELANLFQKNGYEALDFFMKTMPQPSSRINFYQEQAGIMYDELFGENKVMHMGNPIQVSEYIIDCLYDSSNNFKGNMWKFHATTNYDGNDIEKKAGLNYRSRMTDMFNLIKLDGTDRRK